MEQLLQLEKKISGLGNNEDFVGEMFMKKFQVDQNKRANLLGTPGEKLEFRKKLIEM